MTPPSLSALTPKILTSARRVAALKKKLVPRAQWEASFTSAPRMRRLNQEFLGKDYATDVLSFPSPKILQEMGYLGELVICTSVMKRQAREQKHSEKVELAVLVVHGFLHLLGYDHEKGPRQAAQMRTLENALLAKVEPMGRHLGLIERTAQNKRSDSRR